MDKLNDAKFWNEYRDDHLIELFPDELKCINCQMLMIHTYILSCLHSYCTDCKNALILQENKACIKCKIDVDIISSENNLEKNQHRVYGCFNSYKCQWKGELRDFINHSKKCEFMPLSCRDCKKKINKNYQKLHQLFYCEKRFIFCEYCLTIVNIEDYTNHLNVECEKIILFCPYGCKEKDEIKVLTRQQFISHLQKCENLVILCDICNEPIKKKDLETHYLDNLFYHLIKMKKRITILEENNRNFIRERINDKKELDLFKSQIKLKTEENEELNKKLIDLENNYCKNIDEEIYNINDLLVKNETKVNESESCIIYPFREKIISNLESEVWCMLSFNDKFFISGGNFDIILWDPDSYEMKHLFIFAHKCWIIKLVKIDDEHFASCGGDSFIKIWNVESKLIKKEFKGHTDSVYDLVFLSPRIYSVSSDKSIKVWNFKSRKCIKTITGHKDWINCIIEMNKNNLITGSGDKSIKFWNIKENTNTKTINAHNGSIESLLKISCSRFASGSNDSLIKIWDYNSGDCIASLQGHKGSINSLVLIDLVSFASGSDDKTIKIWNISTGKLLRNLESHTDEVFSIIKLNDNKLVSGGKDKNIIFWKDNSIKL